MASELAFRAIPSAVARAAGNPVGPDYGRPNLSGGPILTPDDFR